MESKPLIVLLLCLLSIDVGAMDLGEYSVRDFAALPNIQQVNLSRDGTYLSAVYNSEEGVPVLVIQNLNETGVEAYPVQTNGWLFNWTQWISDHYLLVSVKIPQYISVPVIVTRLMAVNAKTRQSKVLFTREEGRGFRQIQDRFLGSIYGDDERFLIQANSDFVARPAVKRVSVKSQKLPQRNVQRPVTYILNWMADRSGKVRVGTGTNITQEKGLLRLLGSDEKWHEYNELAERDCHVVGLPVTQQGVVYLSCPTEGEYGEVRTFNAMTGEFGELIVKHPQSEVERIVLNDPGTEIDAVFFDSELVPPEYRNPVLNALQSLTDRHFPDTVNEVQVWSANYNKAIVASYSDTQPLHYYLYEGDKKRLDYFTATYPRMMDGGPGLVHRSRFTARDGFEIPVSLTLPRSIALEDAKNLPFIVYPHSGPRARDIYDYDWRAQMLTAAGYGVMQMNFRGSTGYGLAFEKAAQLQWGQTMVEDIIDGTKWLGDSGFADEGRICVLGEAYGGYAAVMAAVKEPSVYRCLATLNGVSDLTDLKQLSHNFVGGRYATSYIGRLWQDRAALKLNSPKHRAEDVRTPTLIVHSGKDRVINVRQSRRLAKALDDQVLWRYVELPDGDHNLDRQENRISYAKVLLEFLHEHL